MRAARRTSSQAPRTWRRRRGPTPRFPRVALDPCAPAARSGAVASDAMPVFALPEVALPERAPLRAAPQSGVLVLGGVSVDHRGLASWPRARCRPPERLRLRVGSRRRRSSRFPARRWPAPDAARLDRLHVSLARASGFTARDSWPSRPSRGRSPTRDSSGLGLDVAFGAPTTTFWPFAVGTSGSAQRHGLAHRVVALVDVDDASR